MDGGRRRCWTRRGTGLGKLRFSSSSSDHLFHSVQRRRCCYIFHHPMESESEWSCQCHCHCQPPRAPSLEFPISPAFFLGDWELTHSSLFFFAGTASTWTSVPGANIKHLRDRRMRSKSAVSRPIQSPWSKCCEHVDPDPSLRYLDLDNISIFSVLRWLQMKKVWTTKLYISSKAIIFI
jgi:hypothetical protein